jgi:hypothetical protein
MIIVRLSIFICVFFNACMCTAQITIYPQTLRRGSAFTAELEEFILRPTLRKWRIHLIVVYTIKNERSDVSISFFPNNTNTDNYFDRNDDPEHSLLMECASSGINLYSQSSESPVIFTDIEDIDSGKYNSASEPIKILPGQVRRFKSYFLTSFSGSLWDEHKDSLTTLATNSAVVVNFCNKYEDYFVHALPDCIIVDDFIIRRSKKFKISFGDALFAE